MYYKVVARLKQGCDKVARTPQPCHHLVISVWDVTEMLKKHANSQWHRDAAATAAMA